MIAIPNALFFVLISIFFVVGIKTGGKFMLSLRGESPKALAAAPERLVDIFERSVEMYRARAVLVNDNAITIACISGFSHVGSAVRTKTSGGAT